MDKVVHFDMAVDDLNRAKKFYHSVFGWNMTDFPGMDYTGIITSPIDQKTRMPLESGSINGGMYVRKGKSDKTVIVINVPSIDEYLKKIAHAGGKTITPKTPIPGMGYYAKFVDTEGNEIGIFENVKM